MSYTCDICDSQFNYTSILKLHYRSHSGEKSFHCVFCEKSFSHEAYLIVHRRIHHQREPCVAEVSNNTLIEKSNPEKHSKLHKDERRNKARKRVLPIENDLDINCGTSRQESSKNCGISNKRSSQNFKLNRSDQPPAKKKIYVCNVCDKKVSTKSNLEMHYRIHTKEKPFVCGTCGKAYTRNFNLKLHLRVHEK